MHREIRVRQSLWRGFGLLLAAVWLTGCASIESIPRRNIVMVEGTGELVDPRPNFLGRHTKFRPYPTIPEEDEQAAYFRDVSDELRRGLPPDGSAPDDPHRILIYIHGGLNTQVSTIERAADIRARMLADPENTYDVPLFINWQSSLVSSYTDHLLYVRQGRDTRGTVWAIPSIAVSPVYLASDLARVIGRAPVVWMYQLENLRAITIGHSDDMGIADRRVWEDGPTTDSEIRRGSNRMRRSPLRVAENVASGVVLAPIRMLLTPFIDAFGSSAWDNMNRRTSTLFNRELDFQSTSFDTPASGALAEFLDALAADLGGRSDVEITLMGHSMGTIVVNEILRQYPQLPVVRIVYMAAACSVRDYQNSVYPYLRAHPDTQMVHLTLHELAEQSERFWSQPDIVPRGSLLVWIDNWLSKPDTRLDRTAGRFVNLINTHHLCPPDLQHRIAIKQFDYGNNLGPFQPQKHGAFGQGPFWRDSFWDPDAGNGP